MVELHPRSAAEYQTMFYEQVGLPPVRSSGTGRVWSKPGVGTIISFGSAETVQTGIGDYVIPCDFVTHYDYDFSYLHFGTVSSGLTYTVGTDEPADQERAAAEKVASVPSTFVSLEVSPVSPVRWKRGLRFKGTELSVSTGYLEASVLPALGLSVADISFLRPNARYVRLPDELAGIVARAEALLVSGIYTQAMQLALVMEFVACLVRPDVSRAIVGGEQMSTARLQVGGRQVTVTAGDFLKIASAHTFLEDHACEFPSIKALARQAGISEQKLKVGFAHMYRMTVWEFANTVRMEHATRLLRETDDAIGRIAASCGYQSQAAFITMYKRWSGMTPSLLRRRLRGGE